MSTSANLAGAQRKGGSFTRLWRTLKQLFHEITGALFALLAFGWMNAAIRAWSRDVSHWLIFTAAVVGALFTFFAFTSFRYARNL